MKGFITLKNSLEKGFFNRAYFVFFITLPLVYSKILVDAILIPRQLFTSVFLFIVFSKLLSGFKQNQFEILQSFCKLKFNKILLIFIIINVVSCTQSKTLSESFYVVSKYSLEILFFFLTTFLIIIKELKISTLIKSMVGFCLVAVSITIYQIFEVREESGDLMNNLHLIRATFANKNLVASILFLMLPFVFSYNTKSVLAKICLRILLITSVFLIVLTNTRATMIALILSFFSYILLNAFLVKAVSWKQLLRTIISVIVTVGTIYVTSITMLSFDQKGSNTFIAKIKNASANRISKLTNDNTIITRIRLWDNSIQMVQDNFWLGVGPGNWQIHFPAYGLNNFSVKAVRDGLTTYQRPHNDFLWIFCETGIFGISAYLATIFLALSYATKLLKNKTDTQHHTLNLTLVSTIFGFLMIQFADFPLERIEHQLVLFVIFSIIVAQKFKISYQPTIADNKTLTFKIALSGFIYIVILFSIIVCTKRAIGEYHSKKLVDNFRKENWELVIKEAEKATNAFYTMDPMSVPISWYKGIAYFSMGDIVSAHPCFENAYNINPNNIHVINNLATSYESQRIHNKAEELYLEALAISENFEEARLNLSAVYFNINNIEKAFETIDKCDINSVNPKYFKEYLPPILSTWLKYQISTQTNRSKKEKLETNLKERDKLIKMYFESKHAKISFLDFLILKT